MSTRWGKRGLWLSKCAFLLTLVGALLASSAPSLAQDIAWEEYTVSIENLRLSELAFVDENTGWGVGSIDLDPGARQPQYIPAVIHTTDGGDVWEEQKTGFEGQGYLEGVSFLDPETGAAVGQEFGAGEPLILRTINGGATWSRAMVSGVLGALSDVTFTNDGAGWSVGTDFGNFESLILRSSDGETWIRQSHPTQNEAQLSAVAFPSAMVGFAVGGIGWESPKPFMLKTENGGDTWTEVASPLTEGTLNDVFFLDELIGWAVGSSGDDGVVLKTTDGGSSWEVTRVHGSRLYFKQVTFLGSLRGFALAGIYRADKSYSALYETLNGGSAWQKLYETERYLTGLCTYNDTLRVLMTGTKTQPGPTTVLKALIHALLTRIAVTPPEVTVSLHDTQQFQAKGYDRSGNVMPVQATWTATGGTITTGGLYMATTAGNFTVTASVEGSTVTGTASVHVNPPELTRIDVDPPEVTLNVNEQQQFQATGYDRSGNVMPVQATWTATGGTISTGGLYTATTGGNFTVTASVEGSTVTGTAAVHVNPPGPPMQTYKHATLGTLCYPPGWTVQSTGPDHVFFTGSGQLLAGYRLWDPAMGASPQDFVENYYATKPEGTVVDESVPATLCGSPALSTTLRYPWGLLEVITVTMRGNRPAKLFVEGPPEQVAEFVAASYYGRMAGCCQFP